MKNTKGRPQKTKNIIMPALDCAFLKQEDNSCLILTIEKCNALQHCAFYKTTEELKAGRMKAIKRLRRLQ